MVMSTEDGMNKLLEGLLDAKSWPARFRQSMDDGVDVRKEIAAADMKVEGLEKQAKAAIKSLGCVSPETRAIYHRMADMLISWQTFKDSLE
jgi:hypothetical protein